MKKLLFYSVCCVMISFLVASFSANGNRRAFSHKNKSRKKNRRHRVLSLRNRRSLSHKKTSQLTEPKINLDAAVPLSSQENVKETAPSNRPEKAIINQKLEVFIQQNSLLLDILSQMVAYRFSYFDYALLLSALGYEDALSKNFKQYPEVLPLYKAMEEKTTRFLQEKPIDLASLLRIYFSRTFFTSKLKKDKFLAYSALLVNTEKIVANTQMLSLFDENDIDLLSKEAFKKKQELLNSSEESSIWDDGFESLRKKYFIKIVDRPLQYNLQSYLNSPDLSLNKYCLFTIIYCKNLAELPQEKRINFFETICEKIIPRQNKDAMIQVFEETVSFCYNLYKKLVEFIPDQEISLWQKTKALYWNYEELIKTGLKGAAYLALGALQGALNSKDMKFAHKDLVESAISLSSSSIMHGVGSAVKRASIGWLQKSKNQVLSGIGYVIQPDGLVKDLTLKSLPDGLAKTLLQTNIGDFLLDIGINKVTSPIKDYVWDTVSPYVNSIPGVKQAKQIINKVSHSINPLGSAKYTLGSEVAAKVVQRYFALFSLDADFGLESLISGEGKEGYLSWRNNIIKIINLGASLQTAFEYSVKDKALLKNDILTAISIGQMYWDGAKMVYKDFVGKS